jgi:hypothetical protein
MRVILIYATSYSYSSSNPMLWLHTVVWGGGGSRAVEYLWEPPTHKKR